MSEAENGLLTYFYPHSLVKGKPTTIFTSIYVESFGNIEEANMVCMLNCISLLRYKYGKTPRSISIICFVWDGGSDLGCLEAAVKMISEYVHA